MQVILVHAHIYTNIVRFWIHESENCKCARSLFLSIAPFPVVPYSDLFHSAPALVFVLLAFVFSSLYLFPLEYEFISRIALLICLLLFSLCFATCLLAHTYLLAIQAIKPYRLLATAICWLIYNYIIIWQKKRRRTKLRRN